MNRLNIGIVCYPSVGGSGVVATNLGLELARLGHQVHFISYEPPFRLYHQKNIFFHKVPINEYTLFRYPDYTLPLAVKIAAVHQKYQLDVVHVHYAVPHATAAVLACEMMRKTNSRKLPAIITTLHGTDITLLAEDPALFPIIKYSIESSDGVTAVSKYLKTQTQNVLKTKCPIQVIYNFYTPHLVANSHEYVRKKLNVKADDFLAIHLSNLRPVKRIPDLLKVVSLIPDSNFKLLVLAGGDFSSYQPLVKKLKLAKKIIVKNNIKDIENYISVADIGLFTSEEESFGMGVLECMAYGLAVVATAVGGTKEVMINNKTGFLLPVGDVRAIAAKIRLLMEDENLRKRLGESAKKHACEKFCSGKVVPEYLDYYNRILKTPKK